MVRQSLFSISCSLVVCLYKVSLIFFLLLLLSMSMFHVLVLGWTVFKDFEEFNGDISKWNTGKVASMSEST